MEESLSKISWAALGKEKEHIQRSVVYTTPTALAWDLSAKHSLDMQEPHPRYIGFRYDWPFIPKCLSSMIAYAYIPALH